MPEKGREPDAFGSDFALTRRTGPGETRSLRGCNQLPPRDRMQLDRASVGPGEAIGHDHLKVEIVANGRSEPP